MNVDNTVTLVTRDYLQLSATTELCCYFSFRKQIATHRQGVFIKSTVLLCHGGRLSKARAIHKPSPNKLDSQLHQLCLLSRSLECIDCRVGAKSRSDVHITNNSGAHWTLRTLRAVCIWWTNVLSVKFGLALYLFC